MNFKKISKRLICIIFVCFLFSFTFFKCIFSNFLTVEAKTVTSSIVLDDLSSMTINGEPFNTDNFGYDDTRDVQVISFLEYGYSLDKEKQADYALFVYLYNPKGLTFANDKQLLTVA